MAWAGMAFRELRFIIEPELTQVYVFFDALGDCPIGVQGWHHKTFPASVSVLDIISLLGKTEGDSENDPVLWPLAAPPAHGVSA